MPSTEFRALVDDAVDRYRPAGRFATGFARGKLLGDPVFEYFLRAGLLGDGGKVLDLGCGQGLLAALLEAVTRARAAGRWPAGWASPPLHARVHGIELMPRDVARARAALGDAAEFVVGDVAGTPFPVVHRAVILDVLHYMPIVDQDRVLARVKQSLAPGGRLLLRVGDAEGGFGFRYSNWVDHVVTWCRGHRLGQLYCRPLRTWIDVLRDLGFEVRTQPMSQGTMFANVLLIADLGAG